MENLSIVDRVLHENLGSAPYVASIVDDPNDGKTKLVIMFQGEGCTAVLSLDSLIEEEDISNSSPAAGYEEQLRDVLWDSYGEK